MKPVLIDNEKCIGCGKCVKDCVSEKIKIIDGKAEFMYERCIQCGHCYAICPTGAVTMTKYKDYEGEEVTGMTEFDSDKLLAAMKSRRTIRQFKDKKIPEEDINKIIEAGRYCPTGTNAQDFSFTVITDAIDDIESQAVKLFQFAKKTATPFSKYIRNTTIDDKFFFKGAAAVIVVSGKGSTSACLASSYMEIMANTLGIGVLYSGFFIAAAKLNPKILSKLEIEKGHSPVTCLVLGYPDVEYKRVPPRNKAKVRHI